MYKLFIILLILTQSLFCFGQTNTPRTTAVMVGTTNGNVILVVTNRDSWRAALGFVNTNNGDLRYFPLLTGDTAGQVPTWNGSIWTLAIPSGGTNTSTGSVSSITFLSPLTGGTITNSGTVSIPAATTTNHGYLSTNDWQTFNAKEPAISSGASNQFFFQGKAWKEVDWTNIISKPSVFTPDAHSHTNYLTNYTETDPVFTNSGAYGITTTNRTNWNTAYGWGNHATRGYLTNETDPVFTNSAAYLITTTNITNWNTAYTHSQTTGNPHSTEITNITGLRGDLDSRSLTNHLHSQYLTNFTEGDPLFTNSVAYGLNAAETNFWTTNFGNYLPLSGGTLSGNLVMQTNANIQFSNSVGTKIILYDMGNYGRTNYELAISVATLDYKIPKTVGAGGVSKHRFSANEYTLADIQYGDNETNYLTVYGGIKSTTNGYIFPDATVQTTAATNQSGVVITNNGDYRYQQFRRELLMSETFPGVTLPSDWIVQGGAWTCNDGLIPPASGGTGTRIMWTNDTAMERVSFRAWVTIDSGAACVALSREPIIATKGFLAEMCLTNSTIRFWDYGWTAPVASKAIPFAIVAGRQYVLELRKYDGCNITFTVTDNVTGNSVSLSTAGEGTSYGSGTGNPGIVHFNGSYTVDRVEFGTMNPRYPRVVIVGDSNVEGVNVGAIGDMSRRWSAMVQNKLSGRAAIAGRGGENSASIMPGVAPWTRFLTDVETSYPEYVIYSIGSNDTDTNTWKLVIGSAIARITNINATPILCTVPPRTDGYGSETDRRTMSVWVRNSGYNYIDIRKAVSADDATIDADKDSGDNVHFNYAGHSNIFNRVMQDVPWLVDPGLEVENHIGPYGRVGIGTEPDYDFHVATDIAAIERRVTAGGGPSLALQHARDTSGNRASVESGDELGAILYMGHNGTEYKTSAYTMATADGSVTNNGIPSKYEVYLTRPGDTTPSSTLIVKNGGLGFNITPEYAGHFNMTGSYAPALALDGQGLADPILYFRSPLSKAYIQSGLSLVLRQLDDGNWYDRFTFRTNGYFYPASGIVFPDSTYQTTSPTNYNFLYRTETATNSWKLRGYDIATTYASNAVPILSADGYLYASGLAGQYWVSTPEIKNQTITFSTWTGTNEPTVQVYYPGTGYGEVLDSINHPHPLFTSTDTNHWSTAYSWGDHSGLYYTLGSTVTNSDKLMGVGLDEAATASTVAARNEYGHILATAFADNSPTTAVEMKNIVGHRNDSDKYLYSYDAAAVRTFVFGTNADGFAWVSTNNTWQAMKLSTNSGTAYATNFALPDGSVSSPSLYWANDTNTGLWQDSLTRDTINFSISGSTMAQLGTMIGRSGFYLSGDSMLYGGYSLEVNAGSGYGISIGNRYSNPVGIGCAPDAGAALAVTGTIKAGQYATSSGVGSDKTITLVTSVSFQTNNLGYVTNITYATTNLQFSKGILITP